MILLLVSAAERPALRGDNPDGVGLLRQLDVSVVGVFAGAWLSATLGNDRTERSVPRLWEWRFGPSISKRLAGAFFGGALMMFGARLAQGCTSGHGISGALQLALSSWIFVILLFISGTLMTFAIYGREGKRHV